jgi:hypothetical protein
MAGCFNTAEVVYQAYLSFVSGRRLGTRIRESRSKRISNWDQRVFAACGYSVSEHEINHDTVFDPFAIVVATADRNYFQGFWEYLLPAMSEGEQERLFVVLRRHYQDDFRSAILVPPAALTPQVR